MKNQKFRNEWKFVGREADLIKVEARLRGIMEPDDNGDEGVYRVRSLYFDDLQNSAADDTAAGVSERNKWRIRYYGDDPTHLSLECKEKREGMCRKSACLLTHEEYESLLSGNVGELLWREDKPLLRKFAILMETKVYRPAAIIDYERTAFVEPLSGTRITFDRRIAVGNDYESFLTGDYLLIPLEASDRHVLEVKFDEILPGYIKSAAAEGFTRTSYSKYYLGRRILSALQ